MRLGFIALCSVGCGFGGGGSPDAADIIDMPIVVPDAIDDAMPDALEVISDAEPDALTCTTWSPHHFDPCAVPAFQNSIEIDENAIFDTTTGVLRKGSTQIAVDSAVLDLPTGNQVRVWSVIDFALAQGVTLRVIGQHPLLIAAEGRIVVRGLIDAASRGTERGGGSRAVPCATGIDGHDHSTGTGGGAGGSFRGRGGGGSHGDNMPGITGGVSAPPTAKPTEVRGGCDGGRGGNNTDDAGAHTIGRSQGGLGGGAIQLSARREIVVAGVIHVGGGGGRGAPLQTASGGGGGGSGGFIGLDAPTINVTGATLTANGGAGGGSAPFVASGTAGGDATSSTQPAVCGPSGPSGDCGVEGAPGSAGGTVAGTTATAVDQCGGGGGGGGAGYVLWWTSMPMGQVTTASPGLEDGPP